MDTKRMRICIALICIQVLQVTASVVTFEASPTEIKANLTDALSMRCSITDHDPSNTISVPDDGPSNALSSPSTAKDVRHLSTIFVTRNDEEDVASMTLLDAPMTFVDGGNLDVIGFVSTTSEEGYLELSWRDPSTIYLGQYTCTVAVIDLGGHIVHMTSDLQLTAATPSINDVIADFNSKLNNLKKENEQLKEALNKTNTNMTVERARQNLILTNLTSDIARLKACTSLGVSFTATFSAASSFNLTGQIRYDKIILNEGNDYDGNTGNFTCSTAGIYVFNIHAESNGGQAVCLQLQVNGTAITSLRAEIKGYRGAASTGVTMHLQQGDVVRVVSWCISTFYQTGLSSEYQSNILTGYLLQGDQCIPE